MVGYGWVWHHGCITITQPNARMRAAEERMGIINWEGQPPNNRKVRSAASLHVCALVGHQQCAKCRMEVTQTPPAQRHQQNARHRTTPRHIPQTARVGQQQIIQPQTVGWGI